ncbi:uncharacterized protein GIQ15_04451 [Arthroderma uncinatum]|uniref:uncharacterized protein n=1 Tax=Arthroderma uncinatum TaxID=74035 RepID=UPI00144A86F7|nr:uncharacterized protein GIQ15_04451 [Arthroderma uncinatum]KAF3481692.1 hypothetical protein GIQ15_04451 [Arthroderma uncinatum]
MHFLLAFTTLAALAAAAPLIPRALASGGEDLCKRNNKLAFDGPKKVAGPRVPINNKVSFNRPENEAELRALTKRNNNKFAYDGAKDEATFKASLTWPKLTCYLAISVSSMKLAV